MSGFVKRASEELGVELGLGNKERGSGGGNGRGRAGTNPIAVSSSLVLSYRSCPPSQHPHYSPRPPACVPYYYYIVLHSKITCSAFSQSQRVSNVRSLPSHH